MWSHSQVSTRVEVRVKYILWSVVNCCCWFYLRIPGLGLYFFNERAEFLSVDSDAVAVDGVLSCFSEEFLGQEVEPIQNPKEYSLELLPQICISILSIEWETW